MKVYLKKVKRICNKCLKEITTIEKTITDPVGKFDINLVACDDCQGKEFAVVHIETTTAEE